MAILEGSAVVAAALEGPRRGWAVGVPGWSVEHGGRGRETNLRLVRLSLTVHQWINDGLMAIFFFESIMFPTIFALGVKDLGHHTKKGSSLIVMSIVGGAIVPYIMGMLSERSTANAYIVPLICFVVVAWFGWKGYKIKK